MPRLYPRTAAMLVLGSISLLSGGYLSNPPLMATGLALILSPLIAYSFFHFSTGKMGLLQAERWTDKTDVFAGEYLYVKVNVRNRSDRPLDLVEVTDRVPDGLRLSVGENTLHAPLDPEEGVTYSYILHCPKRGKYELGPTTLTIKDRFSYFHETKEAYPSQTVYVCPTLEDVRRLEMLEKRGMDILSGVHQTKLKGAGTEFFGLREYVPGDEYRRIDWKATARLLRPVVKEYETERQISVMILLDTSLSMAGGPEGQRKLDYAIRASVLIARLALKRGDKVGILLYSDEVKNCLSPAGGRNQFYDILRALAEAEPGGSTVLKRAVDYVLPRLGEESLLFIITDLEGETPTILDPIQLTRAAGHHTVVISPLGPSFEEKEVAKDEVTRVYARAVAESILEEREMLVLGLRSKGVHVIDVSPVDVLPVVLGEYLKAKARGITREWRC